VAALVSSILIGLQPPLRGAASKALLRSSPFLRSSV